MKHNATCYDFSLQYSACSVVGFDKSTYYRYVQVAGVFASAKALLHTLFHILGRYHEHERPDRDKYVRVIEENILKGANSRIQRMHVICNYRYIQFC